MEGERYDDELARFIYPAWSLVKRRVPREKSAAGEARKVKNQDAVHLGISEVAGGLSDGEAARVVLAAAAANTVCAVSPAGCSFQYDPSRKYIFYWFFKAFL